MPQVYEYHDLRGSGDVSAPWIALSSVDVGASAICEEMVLTCLHYTTQGGCYIIQHLNKPPMFNEWFPLTYV